MAMDGLGSAPSRMPPIPPRTICRIRRRPGPPTSKPSPKSKASGAGGDQLGTSPYRAFTTHRVSPMLADGCMSTEAYRWGYSDATLGGVCFANRSSDWSYMYASSSAVPASTFAPFGPFTVTRQVSFAPGRSVSRKVANSSCSSLSSQGTKMDFEKNRNW